MLWVLALHISALLLWCAALLYLPLLAIGARVQGLERKMGRHSFSTIERFAFTHLASPVALIAIISGTLLFVFNRTVDGWLIAKLTLVTGLVVCHALAGLLVLRVEAVSGGAPDDRLLPLLGRGLGLMIVVLIAVIVWLVLAKPTEDWLW